MHTHKGPLNRIATATVVVGGLALFVRPNTANAQSVYFPTDATINSTLLPSNATIGYANLNDTNTHANPTNPTVTVVNGAVIDNIYLYNSSTVNFGGGLVNVDIDAYDNSILNMSGGTVTQGVNVGNFGQGSGTVNFSGGSIGQDLDAAGGTIYMSGGTVQGGLGVLHNGNANVSGGSMHNITTAYNSTLNFSGGSTTADLVAEDQSTVNITGGNIGGIFYIAGNTTAMNFYGTGLIATLVNPDVSTGYGASSQYTLSGALADGTSLSGKTLFNLNGYHSTFTLNNLAIATTPEPGFVGLFISLCTVSIGLLRRRRKIC